MSYNDRKKLRKRAELEEFESVTAMLDDAVRDTIVPAICTNPECEFTDYMEPDQDAGFCEDCGTNSVKSCLVVAGVPKPPASAPRLALCAHQLIAVVSPSSLHEPAVCSSY